MIEQIKVFHVENEKDIQIIAQLALEKVDYFNVKIYSSDEETLQAVIEFSPDIILLDVMMPGMDGMETYKALQQIPECIDLLVVFMTAKVKKHEVQQYLGLSAIDVISKLFNPMTLAAEVYT